MIGLRALCACLALSLACDAAASEQPTFTIAYDEASAWAPYLYPATAPQPGALREAIALVFEMAGLSLEETFTSRRRALDLDARGTNAVGYGALSWDAGRTKGRLLSATLLRADERLIFADVVVFPFRRCADLEGRPIWGVPGVIYPCGDIPDARRLSNERGLVFRIARGDIAAAVIDYDVARYWGRRIGVGLNIGPAVRTADIRLTLDPSHETALRRLNIAIFDAVRWGRVAEIRRRYQKLAEQGLAPGE
ncbi:MAG: hypothetical protein AAF684_09300 [Pseudomonadota bacterium]